MTSPYFPCPMCVHFLGPYPYDLDHMPTCEAFKPDPIPEEILDGDNWHTEPYPGDHGLVYKEEDLYPGGLVYKEEDLYPGGLVYKEEDLYPGDHDLMYK